MTRKKDDRPLGYNYWPEDAERQAFERSSSQYNSYNMESWNDYQAKIDGHREEYHHRGGCSGGQRLFSINAQSRPPSMDFVNEAWSHFLNSIVEGVRARGESALRISDILSGLSDNVSLLEMLETPFLSNNILEKYLSSHEIYGKVTNSDLHNIDFLRLKAKNFVDDLLGHEVQSPQIGGDLTLLKTPTGRVPGFLKKVAEAYPDWDGDYSTLDWDKIESEHPSIAKGRALFIERYSDTPAPERAPGNARGPKKRFLRIDQLLLNPTEQKQALEWSQRPPTYLRAVKPPKAGPQ